MKKTLMILLLCAITMGTAYAQNQPVDMRFEVTEPATSTCTVVKKLLVGKRLEFLFPVGKYQAVCYVPKSVLRDLRNNFKIDIKLHPSQHR